MGINLRGSMGNYIIYYYLLLLLSLLKNLRREGPSLGTIHKIYCHCTCINQSYQSQLSTFIHKSSFYCTQEAIQTALLKQAHLIPMHISFLVKVTKGCLLLSSPLLF